MNKLIISSLIVIFLAVGGIALLLNGDGVNNAPIQAGTNTGTNVTMLDGKQQIRITAKGGYAPRVTVAKASIPTVINVVTNGTYDCSSALSVPAVGFRKNLPATGTTVIEIPPQKVGATIKGVCSMGMYSFAVSFN